MEESNTRVGTMEGLDLRPSKQGREVVMGETEPIVAAMFTKQGRIWCGGIKEGDNREIGLHGPRPPTTCSNLWLEMAFWDSGWMLDSDMASLGWPPSSILQIRFSPRWNSFFSGDFYCFFFL